MKREYLGGCHCGAVRFRANLDLNAGTFKCNCEMCAKTRLWGAQVAPDDFELVSGQSNLVDYRPENAHHFFCNTCGVRSFAQVEGPGGEKFFVVRVNCLAGVDIDELMNAPIVYFDGLHDNYQTPPAETRHL